MRERVSLFVARSIVPELRTVSHMNTESTWQRATELLPPAIRRRIKGAENLTTFVENVLRYHAMSEADLLRATVNCLLNLECLDDSVPSPDVELRTILVPELWERLQGGTRDRLRRLTSTLAEYNPSSFWRRSRFWLAAQEADMCLAARRLSQHIAQVESADTAALIEQVRFAIAGSHADADWGPTACVYEPGFTYRLVPAIAYRVRARQDGRNT